MTLHTKIWLISDTHFYHGNIIRYCNRPFKSYRDMNETMVQNWNKMVSENDIVIHLGDFAFKNRAKEIRKRLNGIIILIRGNHDYNITPEDGFIIIEGTLKIDNYILSHEPLLSIPEGFINLHGHIHHKDSRLGKNLSVEKTNYCPILFSGKI